MLPSWHKAASRILLIMLVTACRDELDADPCRSQCPLGFDDSTVCNEQPLATFPSYDATLLAWTTEKCPAKRDNSEIPYFVEASCTDGKRVLYVGTGFVIERRYYASAGTFLGLETGGDGGQGPACQDSAYWPVRVPCDRAVVTNIVCGGQSFFKVGETIQLR